MCLDTAYQYSWFVLPLQLVILATSLRTFSNRFQVQTLSTTNPSHCHKPLTIQVDYPPRKQKFRLLVHRGCDFSVLEPTTQVFTANPQTIPYILIHLDSETIFTQNH